METKKIFKLVSVTIKDGATKSNSQVFANRQEAEDRIDVEKAIVNRGDYIVTEDMAMSPDRETIHIWKIVEEEIEMGYYPVSYVTRGVVLVKAIDEYDAYDKVGQYRIAPNLPDNFDGTVIELTVEYDSSDKNAADDVIKDWGTCCDLDECNSAYELGGIKTTIHDYEDDDRNHSKYYTDFDEWWTSLTPEKRRNIFATINKWNYIV